MYLKKGLMILGMVHTGEEVLQESGGAGCLSATGRIATGYL